MATDLNPISLQSAIAALQNWADIQHTNPNPNTAQSSQSPTPVPALRIQIPVRPPHRSALSWLQSQPHSQKLFFRTRGNPARQVAAVGFLHIAVGPTFTQATHLALANLLNPAYPAQRFYGATRFSPDTPVSPEWAPFQGYTFVLPAVELSIDPDGIFLLCANYLSTGYRALKATLSALVFTPLIPSLVPRPAATINLTHFSSWDASMRTILSALHARRYDKIVLARRKRFIFHPNAPPSPTAILAALDAQNARSPAAATRSTYLFCLQLDHYHAFLGCTPERLFHLEGCTILTEALAGTVRRSADGNEGEVLSELLSLKNLEEHRFVVDYIRTALASCNVSAQTNGPHVRRLPRLMHLATDIRAQFPSPKSPDAQQAAHTPQSNVYRLLRTMHPTPAVCGMPRENTMAELPGLEDFDRGFFAGPLGWFSRDAGEFCVAIRSALVYGCEVTAYAGSGIVQASESKSEWDETELKMSAFTDLFHAGGMGRITEHGAGICCPHAMESAEQSTVLLREAARQVENSISDQEGEDPLATKSTPLLAESSIGAIRISATGKPCLPWRGPSSNSSSSVLSLAPSCVPEEASTSDSFDPTKLQCMPNLNALWGCCCVEELCRNGITTFFVAPGSRSAPLAIGVVRSRYAKLTVAHDERGAGFLAVGFARATGRAAAVVTSSGTAVANLLPAVVESAMDSLPMILITADRPPELRDVGANQAIHQSQIFGNYTRWNKDMPCPSEDVPLRNLLSDVDYAVHMSGSGVVEGLSQIGPVGAGPVHLNMMFREKLAPDQQGWDRKYVAALGTGWPQSLLPMTQYGMSVGQMESDGLHSTDSFPSASKDISLSAIFAALRRKKAGLLIVGGGTGSVRTENEGLAIYEIADILGWPVISDVCGGLRFHKPTGGNLVHYADQILTSHIATERLVPDAVLQFGERLTSKRLCSMIRNASVVPREEEFVHVLVSSSTRRCDPSFTVTHRIHSNITYILTCLTPLVLQNIGFSNHGVFSQIRQRKPKDKTQPSKLMILTKISEKVDSVLQELSTSEAKTELTEPWCARVISEAIAHPSALFIGNSMPIRDFDAFSSATTNGMRIKVASNRGASGIDGLVSSGIGFGLGSGLDVTIVLGDMSMLHDMNALHLLRRTNNCIPVNVTIIVVNNGGGGIFSMLPIAKHRDVFSPVFDTPHAVQFRHACDMFGLHYVAVRSVEELRKEIKNNNSIRAHRLIEALVPNDHASNAATHQGLGAVVSQQVSTFFAGNV